MRFTVTLLLLLLASAAEARDKKNGRKKPSRPELVAAADPFASSPPAPATAPAPAASRGPTRIDFDDRLIQGQTNQAGSVYLYDRKQLAIEPMVKKRDSFFGDVLAAAQGR